MRHLMNHAIDIYELKKKEGEQSYGVPQPEEYYYEDEPDRVNVKCRIQRSGKPSIEQGQPFHEIYETYKVFLPKGTIVKEKDKIVFNGVEFYLNIPFSFRTHVEVEAWRVRKQ